MLRIAVCDDQKEVLEEICVLLSKYSKNKSVEIKTFQYDDGTLLLSAPSSFDIIFLDIEMKHSNGIEIAQEIRKSNLNVPIVYITNYTDYWRRAFKVHAFGFIPKPFKDDDIYSCMDDFLSLLFSSEDENIILPTVNGCECINLNEIYYFIYESKKNVLVHTKRGQIMVKDNISDIYTRLNQSFFYKTRRDCIVNLRQVQRIQNEYVIIMKDGSMIPLAQKKKEDFMNKLTTELVKNVKEMKV